MIAVIGAGAIGRRHAGNLAILGRKTDLIPWRGVDLAALAARSDICALVIATATQVRLPLIELAAAKGWPVYCEKPLAWRPEQVDAIFAAAAPIATRSVLGFMMRYHPAMVALAGEDLSSTYGFQFEIGHDVRQWRANWRFAESYAALPEGGGVLLDLCHELDMALALFPGLRIAGVESIGHPDFPNVDFSTRLLLCSPQVTGTVAMDYLSPVSLRKAGLRGTDALRDLDWLAPALSITRDQDSQTRHFDFQRNDMFLALMRDWLALMDGRDHYGNPLIPRFDMMRASCDLVAESWIRRSFTGQVQMDMD